MDDFFFSEKEAEGCFDGDMSPSDLEKLEVEEDMPEIPRADLLLRTGLKQQKLSVLVSLPKVLAATNSKENLVTILDAIKHVWKKGEAENDVDIINEVFTCLQNLASITCDGKIITYPMTSLFEEFDAMMRQYHEEKVTAVFLLTDDQVTKQLLPLVLEFVHELQVKDHAEVASHCVAAMIPRLSGSLKKTQIIRIGIEKGDVSQGAGSRLICCLILGVLTASTLLSEQDIDGLFFQKMMALCQDTDAEVRRCMCMQLDALARAVGQLKASSALLPELLELLQDEEEQVKVMAFQTLLSLYDYFPPRDRRDVILPVIAEILEHPPSYLISPLARLFGRLAFKLFTLGDFTSDHIATFQACYTTLSRSDCPDVRLDCARNLPAVVQAFGPAQYSPHLDDLLQAFTQDTSEPIRRSVVSGLHEVAALLGPQRAQRYLKATSLAVFKDESPTVQGHLIACLPSFVPTICTGVDDDTKNTYIDAMLKAILHHHTILAAGRWREQMTVLDALRHFPTFVSSTQLFERVCPLLFELMNAGARPVQVEAARVLVAVNRDNKITANRVNVLLRLRKEYALGKNFWQRTLYLDACNFACDCYSHQYFRTNYLDPAIDLLEDPVPNVRLKAFALLPKWKPVLHVLNAGDDKTIGRIRSLLDGSHEPDRDVLVAIHDVREAWFHDKDDKSIQEMALDAKKAAAEEAASMNGDHDMYSSEAKWSEMLEYTLIVGKDGQVVRRARVKSIDIVNKLRQQTKDMTTTRGNTTGGGANLRATTTAALAKAAASSDKPTTKLPITTTPMKQQPMPLSTLPTCTPGFSQFNSSVAAKMPSASGSLSARDGKGSNATTSATSLKQLADAKAAIRLNPAKAAVAPGSTSGGRSTKKDETSLTKIPNIPVPTRPAAAPPAKRVQSPSTTKSTTLNSSSRTASTGSSSASSVSAVNSKVTPLAKR